MELLPVRKLFEVVPVQAVPGELEHQSRSSLTIYTIRARDMKDASQNAVGWARFQ